MAFSRGGRSLGPFVRGDVVVLNFPFSDLSDSKRRPALVLATLTGDDVIVCQITSQLKVDTYTVALAPADFGAGGLNRTSYVLPNRLLTVDQSIVLYQVGRVRPAKLEEVLDRVVAILQSRLNGNPG